MILKIENKQEGTEFTGVEFDTKPYNIQGFNNEKLEMSYIKIGTINRSSIMKFYSDDIAEPFVRYHPNNFNNNEYILFDIMNRHS